MRFESGDTRLTLDNGAYVNFDLPIKCAIEVAGVVVVALDVPRRQVMNENVFGVSEDGKILWQIERIPDATYPACMYTNLSVLEPGPGCLLWDLERYPAYKGLSKSYRPGSFLAGNWNGTEAIVDAKTGKVLSTFFMK